MSFKNSISYVFYLLVILVPLVFTDKTSELFEFNKITVVYFATTLIIFFWLLESILKRKLIFKRTALDIPIALFLISQTVSTIFSIDQRTSLLGYYSRFNGGLLSSLSFSILYFGYVTFMDQDNTKKILKLLIFVAAFIAIWAILEHFGVGISCLYLRQKLSTDCWVQDVQNRVFASLGQPNWLAAFIVGLTPLVWIYTLNSNKQKFFIWLGISGLLFLALLFTKSRSGILAFAITDVIFWLTYLKKRNTSKNFFMPLIVIHIAFFIAGIAAGITPKIPKVQLSGEPSLETGGTESGVIRQIVWKGAIEAWKKYPLIGSGVETFAFSYFRVRPAEHNLTSEWDFTYNKAHNEYLNYLATSGIIGLASYILLIVTSLRIILKSKDKKLNTALAAGYVGILVTNFFGFSVVTTSLLFFLFPAIAESESVKEHKAKTLNQYQKLGIIAACLFAFLIFYSISKYWYADTLFASAKSIRDRGNWIEAEKKLLEATHLSPGEPIYMLELAQVIKDSAVNLTESGDMKAAGAHSSRVLQIIKNITDLSPNSVNIRYTVASILTDLSIIDPNYLLTARYELTQGLQLAPTDAKLYYALALNSLRLGQEQEAIDTLRHTIKIKPNYGDARITLSMILIKKGDKTGAERELLYVLEKIDPEDEIAKMLLLKLQKSP